MKHIITTVFAMILLSYFACTSSESNQTKIVEGRQSRVGVMLEDLSFYNPDSLDWVQILKLIDEGYDSFPDEIYTFPNLKELNFSQCGIDSIGNNILKLKKLKTISISFEPFVYLPKEIGDLRSLEEVLFDTLYTNGNLPENLDKLSQIKRFKIGNNKLDSFPNEVLSMINLEGLMLYSCNIDSIPTSIKKLKKLRFIGLTDNRIRHLPKELLEISTLEEIAIGDNPKISQSYVDSLSAIYGIKFKY